MVGNKSGKRISNCAPAIGQCEQHHAAIRGKSSSVMAGVAVRRDARRVVSTPHSLRKLNALRHTCQLKIPDRLNKMG